MTTHQTKISGYTVDLDTDMGDGAAGCWISKKGPHRSEYVSSLALLVDQGALDAANTLCSLHQWAVPQDTIDKISAWAESKGY